MFKRPMFQSSISHVESAKNHVIVLHRMWPVDVNGMGSVQSSYHVHLSGALDCVSVSLLGCPVGGCHTRRHVCAPPVRGFGNERNQVERGPVVASKSFQQKNKDMHHLQTRHCYHQGV